MQRRPCKRCPLRTQKDGGELPDSQAIEVVIVKHEMPMIDGAHRCITLPSDKCVGHFEQNQRVASGQATYNGDQCRVHITREDKSNMKVVEITFTDAESGIEMRRQVPNEGEASKWIASMTSRIRNASWKAIDLPDLPKVAGTALSLFS